MKKYFNDRVFSRGFLRVVAIFIVGTACISSSFAQCPENIDFEYGNFSGWQLYSGDVSAPGNVNAIALSPVSADPMRHALLALVPGAGLDEYGNFPKNCPNGSGHSIKLGNDASGAEAEGASYQFTIPPTANLYTLTYYYAVVFQAPGHPDYQQPRMEVEVLANGSQISCSSFSYIANNALPGFFPSVEDPGVLCRDWTANSINLDGMAGAQIQLFFKTADCTLGGHFGYAYIDVDSKCGSNFPGASFCAGDTSVDVQAPIGYQQYNWHYQGSSNIIGTQPALHIAPAPSAGTVLVVDVEPYPGYGCSASFTVNLTTDLVVTADAGPDRTTCVAGPVQIGVPPEPGIRYSWTPATGLSNANASNPVATVSANTVYTLIAKSPGGGCVDTDQVTVFKPAVNNALSVNGSLSYCEGSTNTILQVPTADSVQWYMNGVAVTGATQQQFTVTASGDYYADVFSFAGSGCNASTVVKHIEVHPVPHASFSVNNPVQCSPRDTFLFQNISTPTGNFQYSWNFDDGSVSVAGSPAHTYLFPGSYNVLLRVTGAGGCADDTTVQVIVKPGAAPKFSVQDVCVNTTLQITNGTAAPGAPVVNYVWDFGNGASSVLREPAYVYPAAGTYTIKLSTTTPDCPVPVTVDTIVKVDAPAANLRYPDQPAIIDFPEQLQARRIGENVLWSPAAFLSNSRIYNPVFRGAASQLYTITLRTKTGCITTDTLLVKPYKKIEINVPTAFSPNNDGNNDLLRPILFGFKDMTYFRVYNRWGKLIFETQDPQKGWDGKINGIVQNMQTVVWMIEAEDNDGKIHTKSGTTILVH